MIEVHDGEMKNHLEEIFRQKYRYTKTPKKGGKGYVTSYHIDSLAGLQLFADTVRKYAAEIV